MELTINKKKKNILQKQIAKSNRSVYIISTISKLLLYAGLIGGTLYLIINFVSPSLSMTDVNGELVKDTSFIIITSSFIFAPCLIFSACLNVLSKNLAGGSSSARIDESLVLVDKQLRYSFRVKHQSTSSERRVITIDFSNINAVDYESKTGALIFTGKITSDYYDDYKKKKSVDSVTIEEFEIYDYFTPSLKETLISKGVQVDQ